MTIIILIIIIITIAQEDIQKASPPASVLLLSAAMQRPGTSRVGTVHCGRDIFGVVGIRGYFTFVLHSCFK